MSLFSAVFAAPYEAIRTGNWAALGQMVIGAALLFVPGAQPIGLALIASAYLSIVSAALFYKPLSEGDSTSSSPTYGFGQFQNPVKGDTPIPVVYSNDTASERPGHKVAPVYVMAFTSPRGAEVGDDDAKAISSNGQGLSMLLAVAEGPIVDIDDIRANGEPLFDIHGADDPVEFKGNGSKTEFFVPGKRFVLDSVRVKLDGTLKGWKTRTKRERIATGNGSKLLFVKDLSPGLSFVSENDLKIYYNQSLTELDTTSSSGVRAHAWFDSSASDGTTMRLFVNTQVALLAGQTLDVEWTERYLDGLTEIKETKDKGLKIKFAVAPTSSQKVTVEYRRRRFPGLRVEWRRGGQSQSPIPDFVAIRNTIGIRSPMAQGTAVTMSDTIENVDNFVIDIASGDGGFTQYDQNTGDRSPVSATFKVRYIRLTSAGALPSPATWTDLRDPAGARGTKSGLEFEMRGDQLAQKFYSIDVRAVLRRLAEDPTDVKAAADLQNFKRGRYRFEVTRTNQVKSGNGFIQDDIQLLSYQRVTDEPMIFPGVALLGIHAFATDRLQGTAPQVTCRVRGRNAVEAYSNGSWVATETAQANPVWAACDLISNLRYGGGQQFTKDDNIDADAAQLAAAYCDATVTTEGVSEKRSVLDYVADTRAPLMEHVRRMLLPAGIIPVIRGNVWSFVIDQAATLADVPVVYDDGSDGRTLKSSMSFSHQPVTSLSTEMQLSYFDRDDDFERNEIWRVQEAAQSDRRIERAQAYGVTRVSQATRYAQALYLRAVNPGAQVGWAMTPGGLRLQAGDVVRVVSTRIGIDLYVRITKWELVSSESMVVQIEAAQYVPAVYGQDVAKQTILRRSAYSGQSAALAAPSTVAASGELVAAVRMPATVQRSA